MTVTFNVTTELLLAAIGAYQDAAAELADLRRKYVVLGDQIKQVQLKKEAARQDVQCHLHDLLKEP